MKARGTALAVGVKVAESPIRRVLLTREGEYTWTCVKQFIHWEIPHSLIVINQYFMPQVNVSTAIHYLSGKLYGWYGVLHSRATHLRRPTRKFHVPQITFAVCVARTSGPVISRSEMRNKFTCAHCGNTFVKGWTDEEAREEYKENFPETQGDEEDVVCSNCYTAILHWLRHPAADRNT